jgi:glycosyltransferase involved in cell wall biosynthesis
MHICVIGLRGIPEVIGGIEMFCENLYPAVRAQDSDTSVTLLIRSGYTRDTDFEWKGLRIKALWSPVMWGVDTLIHTLWALLYARFRLRPHLVHVHGIGPAFFTPLCRLLGMKTIVTHHAPDFERPKWDWQGRLFLKLGERFAAHFAHSVVCVSNAVRDQFLSRYPGAADRTSVIRNAAGLSFGVNPSHSRVLEDCGVRPGSYISPLGVSKRQKRFTSSSTPSSNSTDRT